MRLMIKSYTGAMVYGTAVGRSVRSKDGSESALSTANCYKSSIDVECYKLGFAKNSKSQALPLPSSSSLTPTPVQHIYSAKILVASVIMVPNGLRGS